MARLPLIGKSAVQAVPLPSRIKAPQNNIDGEALREKLTALAKDGRKERPEVLELLKETRESAMNLAQAQFERGRLGGLETARLIASIHDDIVTALFDYVTTHIYRASNPTAAERLVLCAVGGYGRGEMAPQSDLDLLFLLAHKKGSSFTENVTEYILYMLWDMGLKVGHSVRTIDQSLSLSKDDQTILTALLDLRFLSGDKPLAEELHSKFRKSISRGNGKAYIAHKLGERDIRHEREGNSRYVIEPNVKEGKGGLRDLHVLYWIAKFLDKKGQITDPQRAKDYVDMGLFGQASATRFVRAADFLWRARIHLHFTAGRPTEALSFDRQTVLSRKMGYAAGPIEEAVEKFMREYFINAKEVGAITRIACAKLEADNALMLPAGLDKFLPNSKRAVKEPGFVIDRGRLTFIDPMQLRDDPSLILKLFLVAGRRNLDIHPDAFGAINFRRNLMDNAFRKSPENSRIFQEILKTSKAPYATLKVMNEAGVLGRYLIEFGGIIARTQFNMHHAYTVDEHTLRLVNYFHDLITGERESEHPISSILAQRLTEKQKRILYMACLLHDTGKGKGDQCIEGAQLGRKACNRLGLAQDEVDTVAWLIRRHLDFSETAQRRDISDPATISEFGKLVGSQERLELLLILTVVDIRAVGPGIWNDWKGSLLRELYHSTSRFLEGKENLAPASRALAAREQLQERLPENLPARIAPIIQDLGDGYWLNFNMADLVRHMRFFEKVIEGSETTATHTRRNRKNDITELWVLTYDRPGLFSDITQAISASGAGIAGARLHTGLNKRVMNVFYLHNPDGLAFGRKSDHALSALRERAKAAAEGDTENLSINLAPASRRADAIPVKAKVSFPDTGSADVSVIEIIGRDRPGLLYDLADCLLELGLDVRSAHIEVVGEKAVDVFYVGTHVASGTQKTKIRAALLKVLTSSEKAESPA